MRRIAHSLFVLFFVGGFVQAQDTKEVIRKSIGKDVEEVFDVLKSDRSIKHGKYKMIYLDKEISVGQYNMNKRSGVWRFNDCEADIYFVGSYKDGLKDSVWTYLRNNFLASELYFTKGIVDSVFGYHSNGNYSYVQRLDKDGNGRVYSFYENGVVKESIPIQNNAMNGICLMGHPNGRIYRRLQIENNKIISVFETVDPMGRPLEGGTLKDGSGTYIRYFPDSMGYEDFSYGVLATYENGILNGPFRHYNSNGEVIIAGQCKDNQRFGSWRHYDQYGLTDSVNYTFSEKNFLPSQNSDFAQQIGYFVPEIFAGPDVIPDFQYGIDGLHNFVQVNRVFPQFLFQTREIGKMLQLERRVPVLVTVDIDGTISQPEIYDESELFPWENQLDGDAYRYIDPITLTGIYHPNILFVDLPKKSPLRTEYNQEAIRLTNSLPRFSPAFRDNIPISIPIQIVY